MEIIHSIFTNLPDSAVGDAAAGVMNMSWHSGEVLGPITGGFLTEFYSFQITSFIFATALGCLAALYVFRFYALKLFLKEPSVENTNNNSKVTA